MYNANDPYGLYGMSDLGGAPTPPRATKAVSPNMLDRFKDAVTTMGGNMGRLDPRMAGASAKTAVDNAVGGARAAFGKVQPFIPRAGAALAVLGGGLEAKARLDRGEDGFRAAGGGLANAAGSGGGMLAGAAAGAALGSVVPILGTTAGGLIGGVIGGMGGGAAAGFVNDRVTDFVRDNDGKGTDAIVSDLDGQIQQAVNRGDNNRAMELAQKKQQITTARYNAGASPQQQQNRANASDYGVGSDGMPAFNAAVNNAGVGQFQIDAQANGDLRRGQNAFNQSLAQKRTFDGYEDPRLEMIRQQVANTSRANQYATDQSRMIADIPNRMNNASTAALNAIMNSASFAPR